MKEMRFILIIMIGISSFGLAAQPVFRPALQEGARLVGGSMNIVPGKLSVIAFNPQLGFFTVDGFAVGFNADLTIITEKYSNYRTSLTQYQVGPFIKVFTKEGIYFEAATLVGQMIYGPANSGTSSGTVYLNFKAGIGYAAFLNEYVALEPNLTYRTRGMSNDVLSAPGHIVLGLRFSIYLLKNKPRSME